jgi:GNAT superfamily N-acetyltransferase
MLVLNQDILNEFISHLKNVKYKNKISDLNLEHCVDENGIYINLYLIKIKKSQQKKGYGNAILDDIIQLSDKHNVRVKLWMTDVYGVQFKVLLEFYKKHGFFLITNDNDGHMVYYPKKL